MRATPSLLRALARLCASAVAAAGLVALAACDTVGVHPQALHAEPQVTAAEMLAANTTQSDAYKPQLNGAIFQAAQYRPLLEDHRARLVGDTLTINIAERLSATQSATTAVDKSGKISGGVASLPGLSPAWLARNVAVGGSSENSSSGKGQTQNTNDFSGVITATVIGVLPNGHLLVRGEKQIGVNQNVDTLQFTGQVDPLTIVPGNVVQSTQVANVRIQQSGQGAQADAQRIGWLSRFFLNLLPV
jgi:flagellar L-ring protein precursor FlgH